MARSKRRRGEEESESDERWLLTYADMITLLMALFMVLFSISSVNKSKYVVLQKSLKDAFSGRVLPGGKGIADSASAPAGRVVSPPVPATAPVNPRAVSQTPAQESREFQDLKRRIDRYVAKAGLSGQVTTRVTPDGLLIRLLTDKLLFDSGSATPNPGSAPLLREVGGALATDRAGHQIQVKGFTDDVPIRSATFPTNWELSTARASAVVRTLITDHVSASRLTASGRGQLDPITENDTPDGRALNRRVEILLPRQATDGPGATSAPKRLVPTPATEGQP
jgi:chemotaxis protein MotB